MSKAETVLEELAKPVCEEYGCYVYDCEYKKEGENFYLRLFIDKDGGVTIDDCENVSRKLSELLDEKDPINEAYIFEVSSPGMDRALTRPWHFEKAIGCDVTLRLFAPLEGSKELCGTLLGFDHGLITLKTDKKVLHIEKGKTSSVRLAINF